MWINLTGIIIKKLGDNYVNVNSRDKRQMEKERNREREREREGERERRERERGERHRERQRETEREGERAFWVGRHKKKNIDKKMWPKDRLQEIARNINKSRSL